MSNFVIFYLKTNKTNVLFIYNMNMIFGCIHVLRFFCFCHLLFVRIFSVINKNKFIIHRFSFWRKNIEQHVINYMYRYL